MKFMLSLMSAALLVTSCSHTKKEGPPIKESYSPNISFMEEGKKYEATIAVPKDMKDKVPLVVIVHEWWGRNANIMTKSDMLNKEGYATLPVDLFGNGTTVENPKDASALAEPFYQNPQMGVDRLNKYIAAAKKDPHVDASQVFVIGYCFGGSQALNLARSGADVKGVVGFHSGLESSLKSKGIKARVLVLNGLADPLVPAKQRIEFEREMNGLNANFKSVDYKDATHAFTNPNATAIGKKYKIPVAYNKKADEESWKELMTFLEQK